MLIWLTLSYLSPNVVIKLTELVLVDPGPIVVGQLFKEASWYLPFQSKGNGGGRKETGVITRFTVHLFLFVFGS